MPAANLLFRHDFDGVGYPFFNVVWPGFSFAILWVASLRRSS